MKTVFVTGGAGFIGSHLVRQLVAAGEVCVVNIDALTYASDLRLLDPLKSTGRYRFEQADIRNLSDVRELYRRYRPEIVFHLAAESHVDRSIDNPLLFVETNVLGTANLLIGALEHHEQMGKGTRGRFRFVHVSTDEVFGSLDEEGYFNETTPYDPSSPYSASKASSDHMARAWQRTYGLPVIVTNCSNNYGPNQFPEKLIPLITLKAWRGEELPVYGTGENIRDWLHVEDHARALSLVAEKGEPGETYCIGGNNEKTNLDVVRKICDHLDQRIGSLSTGPRRNLIRFVADRPGHDLRYAIDATQIERRLGWRPQYDFDSGLAATVDWYIENEWWWSKLTENSQPLKRVGLGKVE